MNRHKFQSFVGITINEIKNKPIDLHEREVTGQKSGVTYRCSNLCMTLIKII